MVHMVGNKEVENQVNVNLVYKKIIEMMRKRCWTLHLGFVGILPCSNKETELTPGVMDINDALSRTCEWYHKKKGFNVQYISACNLFLKKYKFFNFHLNKENYTQMHLGVNTCVFDSDQTSTLNHNGLLRFLNYILQQMRQFTRYLMWYGIPIHHETQVDF